MKKLLIVASSIILSFALIAMADTSGDVSSTGTNTTGTNTTGTNLTGNIATGTVTTGSTTTGTVSTGDSFTGTNTTGSVQTGSTLSGTVTTGTNNSGSVDTGSVATGSITTGTTLSGTVATGTNTTGALNTGSVNTGTTEETDKLEELSIVLERFLERFRTLEVDSEVILVELIPEQNAARYDGGIILKDTQPAIDFLAENKITQFDTEETFMTDQALRRDEAAAFFGRLAKLALNMTPDTSKNECYTFTDLAEGHADLKDIMIESCQMDLFKGSQGKFMPTQTLTWEQATTVLIRMINGFEDETGTHWALNYWKLAKQLGITQGLAIDSQTAFGTEITRGEVAKMIEAAVYILEIKKTLEVDNAHQVHYVDEMFRKK